MAKVDPKLLLLIPGYDPHQQAEGCWFNDEAALRALDFFSKVLKHVEGDIAGNPFFLEPWQQAIVLNLFGWMKKDAYGRKCRRYRECLLYVPRKNGKTPFAAGIALYLLMADGEPGAQVYSAAADVDQASLLFRHARGMVEQSPMLSKRAKVFRALKSITLQNEPASILRVLSAAAETKHGGNSHAVVIDELHTQPNRDLVDVLTTSLGSKGRRQPLLLHVTTADFARESICNEKYNYACKVRDNLWHDPSFLPVVYEAKQDEDWQSEEVWRRANPNLGVSVSLDYLRREAERAKNVPAYENTFRRLHLNQRTEQDVRWLSMEAWETCGGLPLDVKILEGRECWAGLDLASTTDTASLILLFPDGEAYDVLLWTWIPERACQKRERASRERAREDHERFDLWTREGFILRTPGDVIDYDFIRRTINELHAIYRIREIAIDRWNATQLATQLQGDGFEVIGFGQGFASMSAPTKELEGLVLSKRLRHGSNPVLRWMASNVAVEQDAAGNYKPSKKRSTEKIDGIVALIMALGRAMLRNVVPTEIVWL